MTVLERPSGCPATEECPAAEDCVADRKQACRGVAIRHTSILALCDSLEAIADSLPNRVDRHACLAVASELLPQMRELHAFEEAALFPPYRALEPHAESIRRLRAEHVEDEAGAEELTEVLLGIGHGAPVRNAEALGFMLRALFETVRRHIAFEREHVVPIAFGLRPD